MTRVAIYANQYTNSQEVKNILKQKLKEQAIDIVKDDGIPDYIISIGGDGSLLSAFHQYQGYINHAKFIGIHTGHLGFYTDWLVPEVETLVERIAKGNDTTHDYPLLDIGLNFEDGSTKQLLCLNEFVIRTSLRTIVCDVFLNDTLFETFRGDGICVSTPTGSTGLNKSLGGAVMHPKVSAFQVTDIGPINNVIYRSLGSSLIVPKGDSVLLEIRKPTDKVKITIDNRLLEKTGLVSVKLGLSDSKIKFAGFKHMPFWMRVNSAFIGNPTADDDQYLKNRNTLNGI